LALEFPRQLAGWLSHSRGTDCYYLDVESLRDFERALERGVDGQTSFESVLVVAHSDEEGIAISDETGGFFSWSEFGDALSTFEPWTLVLVACEAGRSTCGRALFQAMPTLDRILACPTLATKQFGGVAMALLGGASDEWLDARRNVLAQLVTGATTGQLLVTWFREDLEDPASALVADVAHQLVAMGVEEITRDFRADLSKLFRRSSGA
jgi:hypothetical protein